MQEYQNNNFEKDFRILQRITCGGFGEVYLGVNSSTSENVAIKLVYYFIIQERKSPDSYSLVLREAEIYEYLSKSESYTGEMDSGFPTIHWKGSLGEYNIMVLQLLGPSLEELLTKIGGKFPLPLVSQLGIQMVSIIQRVHSKGFLHLDIKPGNFLVGMGKIFSSVVYMIDFGLAQPFVDNNGNHLPYTEGNNSFGTERFASIGSHLGQQPSRRDDMESFAYMVIYLLEGFLPWQMIGNGENNVVQMKSQFSTQDLAPNQPGLLYFNISSNSEYCPIL